MNFKDRVSEVNARSEEIQDVLTTPVNKIVGYGSTVIVIILVLVFVFASIVKYPDRISSSVTITSSIPVEKVKAKVGGRIDKMLVSENEIVNANTVLAVLESTASYEDIQKLNLISDGFAKNKIIELKDIQGLKLGEVEPIFSQFIISYIDNLVYSKKNRHVANIESDKKTLYQLMLRLDALKRQQKLAKNELDLSNKNLDRNEKLFKENVISESEIEVKRVDASKVQRDYSNLEITISQIEESIIQLEKNIEQSKSGKFEDDLKISQVMSANFSLLRKTISDWEINYVIRTSVAGRVTFQKFWSANQFVSQGDIVVIVFPQDSKIVGRITLDAVNVRKIKSGDKVIVRLFNYPDSEFGILLGKVNTISLTADEDSKYYIEISMPQKLVTSYHKEIAFNKELLGTCEIVTEDLSIFQRIFHSFKGLMNN